MVRHFVECAKSRIRLRKSASTLKLLSVKGPLEFVTLNRLGELIATERGNRYLLVISDRFSKLVWVVPMERVEAFDIARAFVHHWVFSYGPPRHIVVILVDDGKEFTAYFSREVCRLLGMKNLFTTTYHPRVNGPAERFNHTILATVRRYIGDHPKEWGLHTE